MLIKPIRNYFFIFIIGIGVVLIINAFLISFKFKDFFKKNTNSENLESQKLEEAKNEKESLKLIDQKQEDKNKQIDSSINSQTSFSAKKLENPPQIIKAVYVTPWSIISKNYLDYLITLFKITEINAIVLDIKDYSGYVSYPAQVTWVKEYKLSNFAISDIDYLINFFHQQNIYVIGRITVFQDPALAKIRPDLAIYDKEATNQNLKLTLWRDNKNLFWLDPASKEVWDYNVSLARDAFSHGFDEINFDYVRFPSDGNLKNMGFPFYNQNIPRQDVIRSFFEYLRKNLPEKRVSVDLFGLSTVNRDDLGIGQILEDAFRFFDFVCPMVYPSHYASGFKGFQNPAEFPYDVVKYSLETALLRKNILKEQLENNSNEVNENLKLAQIRPWLQDFNLGAKYTPQMVKKEIQATKDALKEEFNGFMLWSPFNLYTQEAILKISEYKEGNKEASQE